MDFCSKLIFICNWPAHPDDPQGIRVASVFEFSECLFVLCLFTCLFWANFLICYSTVQYSIVQYSTVQYSTVRNLFFKRSGHTVMRS